MSDARSAREGAGLSLEAAARKARIGTSYLRRIERQGGASYALAVRLAAIYTCDLKSFLYANSGKETPNIIKKPASGSGRKPVRRHDATDQ